MKQSVHSLSWKCLCVLAVALCLYLPGYSQEEEQNTTEAGFTVGPMVFLGDLGGHAGKGTTFIKDYNMNTTKLAVGAYYAAYPTQWLGFRLSLNYGNIEGSDADIKPKGGDEVTRLDRNLNFRSMIIEGSLLGEVYPTVLLEDDPEDVTGRLRPYGLIGFGAYHFNPQGLYRDPSTGDSYWVDLRPLRTEGEGFAEYPDRKEYSLTQFNFQLGGGVKYYLSDNLNISFELIHRKLFTDYVDDVSTRYIDPKLFAKYLPASQVPIAIAMSNKALGGYANPSYTIHSKRGDPTQNDAYFTMQVKVAFRINGGTAQRWRNSTHCPLLRF
jgi:opacity protein-like surface antigen